MDVMMMVVRACACEKQKNRARDESHRLSSLRGRGVFGGGEQTPSYITKIQSLTIATLGNTINFGELLTNRRLLYSCSSATRGLYAGGDNAPNSSQNVIEYITIATEGDAFDFELAKSLEENILSKGGSDEPEALYKAYRGRLPVVEALLRGRARAWRSPRSTATRWPRRAPTRTTASAPSSRRWRRCRRPSGRRSRPRDASTRERERRMI